MKTVTVIGKTFGQVVVIGMLTSRRVLGRCACGNEKAFLLSNLQRGLSKSCGHTHTKHGMSYSSEYKAWQSMIGRCVNSTDRSYARYGGRGITVCDRWRYSFDNFLEDMGRKPFPQYSVERINNAGNYEPRNCKWASMAEQGNNRRSCRNVTISGETKTLSQWSKDTGLSCQVLSYRIERGWPMERWLDVVR